MSYHTVYPSRECPTVVCHLLLYLHKCTNNYIQSTNRLWKFFTLQLFSFFSSHLCISRGAGFHSKRTNNFQNFWIKKTICKGVCTYFFDPLLAQFPLLQYRAVFRIRICIMLGSRIRIRIKVKRYIRIRIKVKIQELWRSKLDPY